jgi:hypothetical protein
MGSSSTADARVRLSAEGVQEVVDAFRKVSAEARKTSGDVGLLAEAFKDLKGDFLGGIGVSAAIAGLAELGKKALDHAESMGKLAEKTGATTQMLSVLSLAASTAGASQEDLEKALLKLASTQDQAVQGSQKQIDAFHRLGISMQQIKTLDPAQMFVLIANRLQDVESGTKRAAITHDLLGKSGANLIPVLNRLANEGYDQVAAKARRMGLELDDNAVKAAERAHDALMDLGNLAEGFATQFLTGFAPKAADAMDSLGKAISEKGVNGMQTLGKWVGEIGKGIAFVFITVGQTVGAVVGSIVQGVITAWDALLSAGKGVVDGIKAYTHGDLAGGNAQIKKGFSNAGENLRAGLSTQKDIYSHLGDQYKGDWADLVAPDSTPMSHGGKNGGGDDAGNLNAIARARLAYLKVQADNALALTRTSNQLIEQQNERDYKDGLKTLEDYYAQKITLAEKDSDAEIEALKKKRALTEQEPANNPAEEFKKKQELDKLDEQIAAAQLQRVGKVKALEDERFNARQQHSIQELEMEKKISDLEGDRYGAAKTALDIELAQTEEMLRKQGVAASQIQEILSKIRAVGNARIAFDQASQAGQIANEDLDLAKRDIERRAETGQILDIQAEAQIAQLERSRIENLKQIGKQLTINAQLSGDPKLIEQAKQFNAAVKDLEASTKRVQIALANMANDAVKSSLQSIGDFFGQAAVHAKSFKDALKDLGDSFQQIVAKMISQLIQLWLWMELTKFLSFFAGGGDGGDGLTSPDNFAGGDNGLPGFGGDGGGIFSGASGGWTGNMPPHKFAGIVHGQEFVVKAGPAAQYRALLEAMNSGLSFPGIASAGGGYASGGYVDPAGGGAALGKLVEVNVDTNGQPATVSERQGPDGRHIVDVVLAAVAADIQKGGRTAQAMTNTFGIARKGRKYV